MIELPEEILRLVVLRISNPEYPHYVEFTEVVDLLEEIHCSKKRRIRIIEYLREKNCIEIIGDSLKITAKGIDYLEVLEDKDERRSLGAFTGDRRKNAGEDRVPS